MNWKWFHCFQNQLPENKNRSIYDFFSYYAASEEQKVCLDSQQIYGVIT